MLAGQALYPLNHTLAPQLRLIVKSQTSFGSVFQLFLAFFIFWQHWGLRSGLTLETLNQLRNLVFKKRIRGIENRSCLGVGFGVGGREDQEGAEYGQGALYPGMENEL
jgi:hypothetical protein